MSHLPGSLQGASDRAHSRFSGKCGYTRDTNSAARGLRLFSAEAVRKNTLFVRCMHPSHPTAYNPVLQRIHNKNSGLSIQPFTALHAKSEDFELQASSQSCHSRPRISPSCRPRFLSDSLPLTASKQLYRKYCGRCITQMQVQRAWRPGRIDVVLYLHPMCSGIAGNLNASVTLS